MGKLEFSSVSHQRHISTANPGFERAQRRIKESRKAWVLLGVLFGLLLAGQTLWRKDLYTPEEGFGYFIGLCGGVMILLAYGYVFAKYVPALRNRGHITLSLRIHIYFAVAGSYLAVIHSTAHIGSTNSGVVLTCLVLVFISGVVGRFLYSRIHAGIDQRRLALEDMESQLDGLGLETQTQNDIQSFRRRFETRHNGLIPAVFTALFYPLLQFRIRRTIKQAIHNYPRKQRRRFVKLYLANIKGIALFRIYERLFYSWRHAHVPLLIMLFLSGIVHVLAVHIY